MSLITPTNDFGVTEFEPQPKVVLELELTEAEALHNWLLKANAEGVGSLDEPLVSAALATLSRSVDDVHLVINIRHELANVGLSHNHLADDQVRELGRRIAQLASAGSNS